MLLNDDLLYQCRKAFLANKPALALNFSGSTNTNSELGSQKSTFVRLDLPVKTRNGLMVKQSSAAFMTQIITETSSRRSVLIKEVSQSQ